MAAPGLDAPADDGLEIAGRAPRRPACPAPTSVLASMPNCRHCCAIIEPARVITGRASPSTMTRS